MTRRNTVNDLQKRAWSFYGFPGSEGRPVGEVRYVNGWLADQMTRLDWDVFIGGSETWTVDTSALTADPKAKDQVPTQIGTAQADGTEDVTTASGELLDLVGWSDTTVRAVTTNLFVAGQGDYANLDEGWRVVSVVEKDRKKTLDSANDVVPFLWPHPADTTKPDAPLFSVLDLLDELDWYNRQARTQSRQRVLISGILGIADGFEGPPKNDGTPSNFWDQWNDAMSAKMLDPDDLSPIRLTGPMSEQLNLIKDGINWVVPPFGYDETLDRRVIACINRLAYGLPVPPEILLGMQAQSRATAFQVEENAYRAHIEPPAMLVAQVAQDTLALLLDRDDVEVVPNATRLLARRNSVQDVKDAYDRRLATAEYFREVLGIPEDAAPEAEVQQSAAVTTAIDLVKTLPTLARNPGLDVLVEQISKLLEGTPVPSLGDSVAAAEKDPANVAADEPVTAAGGVDLSDLLADVDAALSSELAGATVMCVDRARQRLGAAARFTSKTVRDDPELKPFSSSQLAVQLGFDGLVAAGVNLVDQITEPVDSLSRWWTSRVGQAWSQVGDLVPGWSGQEDWVTRSAEVLATGVAAHVLDTLGSATVVPADAELIRSVVDAAAGGGA